MNTASTIAASGSKIPIGDAAITALLGYFVVFFGLCLLMLVIILVGKAMTAKKTAVKTETKAVSEPSDAPEAPGSAGSVKLFDVPDKDAAMIMAIVAEKTGKPLNELRFKSIREVK